jgi:hypothetical protein
VDGTYTVGVRLTDTAGNAGPAATSGYVLDATAPAAPRFTAHPASPAANRHPSWTWGGESGAHATCLLTRSGTVIRDWGSCAGSYVVSLNGQPDGTYGLSVRLTDPAGNTSRAATMSYVFDSAPPPPPPPSGPPAGNDGGGSPSGNSGGGTPQNAPPPAPKPPSPKLKLPVLALGTPAGNTPPLATARPGLKPTAQSPEHSSSRPLFSPELPPVGDVPSVIGQVAVKSLEKPQFPLVLLVVVAAFLLIQNRIDRKDPKLANAPVDAEPLLGFGPAVAAP